MWCPKKARCLAAEGDVLHVAQWAKAQQDPTMILGADVVLAR